jgi:hypothetical protein
MTLAHMNGSKHQTPTACAFCENPFLISKDGSHYQAWRGSNGKLYCSEFCASSDEEAEYLKERKRTRGQS